MPGQSNVTPFSSNPKHNKYEIYTESTKSYAKSEPAKMAEKNAKVIIMKDANRAEEAKKAAPAPQRKSFLKTLAVVGVGGMAVHAASGAGVYNDALQVVDAHIIKPIQELAEHGRSNAQPTPSPGAVTTTPSVSPATPAPVVEATMTPSGRPSTAPSRQPTWRPSLSPTTGEIVWTKSPTSNGTLNGTVPETSKAPTISSTNGTGNGTNPEVPPVEATNWGAIAGIISGATVTAGLAVSELTSAAAAGSPLSYHRWMDTDNGHNYPLVTNALSALQKSGAELTTFAKKCLESQKGGKVIGYRS